MNLDLVILNALVIDGTGRPGFHGSVGIRGDRIEYVGVGDDLVARRTIDAAGRVVCPGFIDMHGHSDLMLLAEPHHAAKVMQGVTTEVIGQDGLSYAPVTDATLDLFRSIGRGLNGDPAGLAWDWRSVGEYLDRFDRSVAVNVAYLVPHGPVRAAELGMEDRAPTPDEMSRMKGLVEEAMGQGAFGLSTGLTYAPCCYSDTDELVELAKVVARCEGYLSVHMRCYGARMEAAIEEMIDVAHRSGAPLHLTHFHVSFAPGKEKAAAYIERIDEARRDGVDVTMDHYPYLAGSTFLAGLLPGWAHAGGTDELIRRLTDAATREKIRRDMEETGSDGLMHVRTDWEKIVITGLPSGERRELIGSSVAEISRRLGKPPMDCVAELLVEENLSVSCLIFCGHEENVRRVMRHPHCMMGTDGLLVGDRPHPRAWGTFPRFLATYVRDLGLLALEECIRKMTSLAARRLGLSDRGAVQPGMAADLVIFDPDTVADTATYEHPKSFPTGMPYVIVNGELVKDDDQPTGRLPGRALRKRPGRDVE